MMIAALAYTYARRHATDHRFVFGTGKLGDLAGFTSAIVLAMIAVLIGYEAITRFRDPVSIEFREAIPIAIVGLVVNLLSAWLLSGNEHHGHSHGGHDHSHDHDHQHDHSHDHQHPGPGSGHGVHAPATQATTRDNSIRSAYAHVLADAFVSVLAITGLILAKVYGWLWMDPLAGIIGALVIANWAVTLIRDTGSVLLDVCPDEVTREKLRRTHITVEVTRAAAS
jgi:cation diffusion facilitator family transporter